MNQMKNKIRNARLKMGITQVNAAKLSSVTLPTYNHAETGKSFPNGRSRKGIAKALNLDPITFNPICAKNDKIPIESIVAKWLIDNGYDGLFCTVEACGCGLGDLFPCGDPNFTGCVAAYKEKDGMYYYIDE